MLVGREKLYFTSAEREVNYLKQHNFLCTKAESPYNDEQHKRFIYIFKGNSKLYNALSSFYSGSQDTPERLKKLLVRKGGDR